MLKQAIHHEREFLPAALELEETPASPTGRLVLWVIVLIFTSSITWASIGRIDIVAIAPGKIIPNGHTKQIQTMEIGIVKAIHVQEGQAVKQGDVLIELDDQNAKADQNRMAHEKQMLEQDIQRIDTLLLWHGSNSPILRKKESVDLSDTDNLGHAQWQEYSDTRQGLVSAINKFTAEHESVLAQQQKFDHLLPILTKKAGNLKKLSHKKLVAEQQYLDAEQQRIETVHDLKTSRARTREIKVAIEESQNRLEQYESEFKRSLLEKQNEARRRKQSLEQELIKAGVRANLQTLTAPVNGVVQQLAVHTIGGVVTPAQSLMVVVPNQSTLEVEAFVENKDIGFVEQGQQVEVKVDAFPFTKYGVIKGKILHLSNDAITDDQGSLIYKARVALNNSQMLVNGKAITLTPGMTVIAEAKTGTRKLIEYFLSPLLRYKDESVRER